MRTRSLLIWLLILLALGLVATGCPGDDDDDSATDDDDTTVDDDDTVPDDDDSATDDDDATPPDDDDATPPDDDDSGTDDDDATPPDDDDDSSGDDDDSAASVEPDCVIDFWSCSAPKDCVEVAMGCCSCNNGGASTAINGACLSQWQANIEATQGPCADLACMTVYLCDGSIPRCELGVCTYHL